MQENIANRLRIMIEKSYYLFERYNTSSTFVLIYVQDNIEPIELGKYVRKSDHFLKIDENHYFINFMYIDQSQAFKAAQNLLLSLDKHFNSTASAIAIDTFNKSKNPTMVYNRLVEILKETRANSYNRIEDENILSDYF